MKSILNASVCAAVLTFAIPALAATDASTSTPPAHHHTSKHHEATKGKKGAKSKLTGDAAVQDLNSKSLAAARAGQPLETGSGATSAPASSSTAPVSTTPTATTPATGTPATTTTTNAPGGQ